MIYRNLLLAIDFLWLLPVKW